MYRIVLPLPLSTMLVTRLSFETQEAAFAHMAEKYPNVPAMEVWTQEQVDAVEPSTRKIMIPEKLRG